MIARFHALDRLRALAVISMVQGHTFTALLARDALPASVLRAHALVHGLTAPAFLFGAGLAFGIATYPRYPLHHGGGEVLWARLRRYAGLIVLGYALQLPGSSLLAALQMRGDELVPLFRVGPLHLIALCLGICQLAALALPSARAHALFALALGVAVMFVSPAVFSSNMAKGAGIVVGPWLDASSGSLFPIFPWASFALFGVACAGPLALSSVRPPGALVWIVPGLLLAALSYALFRAGVRLSEPKWFWHASPINVVFRVGIVIFLLGLLHAWSARPGRPGQPRSWSSLLARHSLVAYVSHLLILYGTPFTPSLTRRFGLRLDALQATLAFAGIFALTMLAAHTWAWLARERALARGWVQLALAALGLFVLTR